VSNIKSIFVILAATLLVACSSVDCGTNGRVTCNFAIQDEDGKSYDIPYYLSVTITRSIDGSDTTLVNKQYAISSLNLPMSYVGESDTYTFTIEDDFDNPTVTVTDKLTISKTNKPHFEDVECVARYYHTITDIESTTNYIEDFELKNNSVTNNASVTNIILRVRPTLK
jgi:hypothetical protein